MASLRSLPTPSPIIGADGLAKREPENAAGIRRATDTRNHRERVTDELLAVQAGGSGLPVSPVADVLPYNAVTGEQYKGGNVMRLAIAEVEQNYGPGGWAGFKQWITVGRVVRKGEHGTPIGRVFTKKDPETGETVGTGFGGARVFHYDQTTELETEGGA